jgi:hypothetical protein
MMYNQLVELPLPLFLRDYYQWSGIYENQRAEFTGPALNWQLYQQGIWMEPLIQEKEFL